MNSNSNSIELYLAAAALCMAGLNCSEQGDINRNIIKLPVDMQPNCDSMQLVIIIALLSNLCNYLGHSP